MILAYNTNGFSHHRLHDAIVILAALGYRGLALTPDVHHLNLWTGELWPRDEIARLRDLLHSHQLLTVVETGARFILDPWRKHQPTLISKLDSDRNVRSRWLMRCIDLAAAIDAPCVSLWSGSVTDDADRPELMTRLASECRRLADYALDRGVRLAFEPEPGMFISTLEQFAELHTRVAHPAFGLTVDVGHLICNGEGPVSTHLLRWKDWLWNIHIEDMRQGVHDHLMFGEGDVDFADVFAGLRAAGYRGFVSVELSRHSHDAVNIARASWNFLQPYFHTETK